MSFDNVVDKVSLPANADLSAKQYYFGKISNSSGTGRVAVCGDGERAAGVIYEGPSTAGLATVLAIGGVVKVLAAGVITAGNPVASDADGKAVAKATADNSLGIALETAAAGDVISMLWQPNGTT